MGQRLLSMLLVCCLLVALLPTITQAATVVDGGICGDNLIWTLDGSGILTISGVGEMEDYTNISSSVLSESTSSAPWFTYSKSIKTVNIEDGITKIGKCAFSYCFNLTQVAIPSSVQIIGEEAFSYTKIKSIDVPSSVVSIDGHAFYHCEQLTEILLHDGLTYIGDAAFKNSGLLKIRIPDTVTYMGHEVFRFCYYLREVVLPSGTTNILNRLFDECLRLETVSIPAGLKAIGYMVFDSCPLKDIYYDGTPEESDMITFNKYNGYVGMDTINGLGFRYDVDTLTELAEHFKATLHFSGTEVSGGGDANTPNVYYIYTSEDLDNIRNDLSATYYLQNDLDLSDYGNWDPIGGEKSNWSDSFIGELNGQGHVIRGMTIYNSRDKSAGLFSQVRGTIKNLSIENANIENTTIWMATGGLVGDLGESGVLINCASHGFISGYNNVGGLVGFCSKGQISNCYSTATVTGHCKKAYSSYISGTTGCGGLVGMLCSGSLVKNSYAVGEVGITGISDLNGLIGSFLEGTVSDCYYSNYNDPGISDSGQYILDNAMKQRATYVNWDFDTVWTIDSSVNNGYPQLQCFLHPYTSNACGDNLTWTLADDGTLTISGTGSMWEFAAGQTPWYDSRDNITAVVIEAGVTNISEMAFAECSNLTSVTIGEGVTSIGWRAFYACPNMIYAVIPDSMNTIGQYAFSGCDNLLDVYYLGNSTQWKTVCDTSGITKNDPLNSAIKHYNWKGLFRDSEDPADFNPTIYRANLLINSSIGDGVQNSLAANTPCNVMVDELHNSGFEDVAIFLQSLELISGTLSDITKISDFAVEPRDLYEAVIFEALEATYSPKMMDSNLTKAIKDYEKFISNLKSVLETEYGIEARDQFAFQKMTPKGKEILSEAAKECFAEEFGALSTLCDAFSEVVDGIKIVDKYENYFERIVNSALLLSTSEDMKAVIRQAYNDSLSTNNKPLSSALHDCLVVLESSTEQLTAELVAGSLIVSGYEGGKYLIKDLWWKKLTKDLYAQHPTVAVLHATYKVSKYISNSYNNTDKIIEQYMKMLYIMDVESLINMSYAHLADQFIARGDAQSAEIYLSAVDLMFMLRDLDCKRAADFVSEIDSAFVNKIGKLLGREDADLSETLKALQNLQKDYAVSHESSKTFWINYLELDYPDSGLEEKYSYLFDESQARLMTKEYIAACPINIYVYDANNQIVASIIDGSVSCSDNLMVALVDDTKIVRFYDNQEYHIEYLGTDTGVMDVTISEFDQNGESIRTVNYYDVALEEDAKYTVEVRNNVLDESPYVLLRGEEETAVASKYDSLQSEKATHSVYVQSGTLLKNNRTVFSTEANAGETLELNAIVPDNKSFVCWTASNGKNIFSNRNAQSTSFVMPKEDVVIQAVTIEKGASLIYTVSVEGGTGSNNYSIGDIVTITANAPESGKRFKEWTGADGLTFTSGSATTTEATFTMPASAVSVTATYEDIPATTYTITFDPNGGSMMTVSAVTDANGKLNTLPTPTRSRYSFNGWYTTSSGGTQITASTVFDSDATIYAQWTYAGGSGGGGSSGVSSSGGGGNTNNTASPTITTETTNNSDGSVTTTTTQAVTNPDGTKTITVTTETKTTDGTIGIIVTDGDGKWISTEVRVSQAAVDKALADNEPVQVPITVTPVPIDNADATGTITLTLPELRFDTGSGTISVSEMPKMEIALTKSGPGIVAMLRSADGGLTIIKECYEGSIIFPVEKSCEIIIVDNTKSFSDVTGKSWYSDDVVFVTAHEIFNGVGDGLFSPTSTMNRAMIAQVLYNFDRNSTAGIASVFSDIKSSDWYADAVGWASKNAIVNGYGDSYGATDAITRQDLVTILYRYAKGAGYDTSATANLSDSVDGNSVADYAQEAMQWAINLGIIGGYEDETIRPTSTATRAEVAAIMTRFVSNVR